MIPFALKVAFWVSLLAVVWTYVGYHLFMWVLSHFMKKETNTSADTPKVSIVITANNEEENIAGKINNCLSLDYPRELVEVIVASDGSTDRTNEIVESYSDRGIQLVFTPERNGKHFAQKLGIDVARSDLMVFTDATTFLEKDALRRIIRSFSDPQIGCVSGIDKVSSNGPDSQGEGLYVRYEMKLRSFESGVCSLVGVSGSFFAARRSLCEEWYNDLSSDFFLPVTSYMKGYRSVLDESAVGKYNLVQNPEKEFQRKVRTVVHGIEVLMTFKEILNPFRYGFYSFQLMSHKLMRWLVPLFLAILFVANFYLTGHGIFYNVIFAAQIIFYLFALIAYLVKFLENKPFFRIPFFFVMVNLSIVVAWLQYARGERYVTWERTSR